MKQPASPVVGETGLAFGQDGGRGLPVIPAKAGIQNVRKLGNIFAEWSTLPFPRRAKPKMSFPRKRESIDLRKSKGHTRSPETRGFGCLYHLRTSIESGNTLAVGRNHIVSFLLTRE